MKFVKNHLLTSAWQVDPFSSVSAAHEIGEHVRHQIHKSHPEVAEVFIHIGIMILPHLVTTYYQICHFS